MTASSLPPPSTDIAAGKVFLRAATAEWTRLWTLRSTWWALSIAGALFCLFGAIAGASHEGLEPAPIWQVAQVVIVPGQFVFLFVVLLAVTGEYSTGAIRSSLQWAPRRRVLLAARTLVPVAFVTVSSVVVSAAAGVVAWAFLGEAAEVVAGDIAASLGRIAVVVAFGGFLTAGIGLLLRNTAGTSTAIFLLILALPIGLGNTGIPALTTISDHLPGRAIIGIVILDEVELTARTIATAMIAWTVATVAAGSWSLLCRDTT